mgnify:CR=1 FL=1
MDTRETLRHYISTELLLGDIPVQMDDNLLSNGMVNSLGMMRLVTFIEDTFNIQVAPEDFIIENFRTIDVVAEYINRHRDG